MGGDGSSTQLNFLKKFQPPYNNDDDVISTTLNFIRNVDSENYFKIHPLKYTNLTLLNFIYNNSVTISHKAIRKQILHRYNLPPDFKGGKTEWFDSISSISKDINDLMFLRNYHPNKILEHSYQRTDSPLTIEKLLRNWLSFASKNNEEIELPSGLSWKYKKTSLKLPDNYEQILDMKKLSETAQKFNNCILEYYRELSQNKSQIFIIKDDRPAILELYIHEFNEISIGEVLHKNNVPLSMELKQKVTNDIRKAIINHQGRIFVKIPKTDNLPF